MKTEVRRNWYQLVHFSNLPVRKVSFSGPQWTPSRENHKLFQRLQYFLTLSQPVGLVIFLSGQISLWIFCYSIGSVKKSKDYTDERINAEMKSLSILCVGGILFQLAKWAGGGGEAEKADKKKVGLLRYIPSKKYFIVVYKKMREIK